MCKNAGYVGKRHTKTQSAVPMSLNLYNCIYTMRLTRAAFFCLIVSSCGQGNITCGVWLMRDYIPKWFGWKFGMEKESTSGMGCSLEKERSGMDV